MIGSALVASVVDVTVCGMSTCASFSLLDDADGDGAADGTTGSGARDDSWMVLVTSNVHATPAINAMITNDVRDDEPAGDAMCNRCGILDDEDDASSSRCCCRRCFMSMTHARCYEITATKRTRTTTKQGNNRYDTSMSHENEMQLYANNDESIIDMASMI